MPVVLSFLTRRTATRRYLLPSSQYTRHFSSKSDRKETFYEKAKHAWNTTPVKWYPLPLSTGILLLVFLRWRKRHAYEGSYADSSEVTLSPHGQTLKIKRPLHIHVLGALPLRSMSRLWGYLNSLELPMWFRPFGFRFYAYLFDCNLDEIDPTDLRAYKSLGDFFYRKLAPNSRPIDNAILVSPADGTVLHFGTITDIARVEQVKGVTYSLDALLGAAITSVQDNIEIHANKDHSLASDTHFANVNGIGYSLEQLLGPKLIPKDSTSSQAPPVSTLPSSLQHDLDVAISGSLTSSPQLIDQSLPSSLHIPWIHSDRSLYFAIIYLAPGDYHRFHSPSNWVVNSRRHFVGELFSVSPYMARRLRNLFVLNERVVLLGRWRYGFFSMVPVGATNVGSIKINFDKELRTNTKEHRPRPSPGSYVEASYANASTILGGQPVKTGDELGGFCLGSTIVLLFEAPKSFEFSVHKGQKIKVGQKLGEVDEDGQ